MTDQLQQISINAIALNAEAFTNEQKQQQWIGNPPAKDEAIAAAEKKLGITLPNDVKQFYKIANGTAEILSHCFSGFDAIEKIDWLKNAIPSILIDYAGMGETYAKNLENSIIIAGVNHVHNILIIKPHDDYKNWRYWEFAHYIPGESEFKGIEKYLERLENFLTDQVKNKNETENN